MDELINQSNQLNQFITQLIRLIKNLLIEGWNRYTTLPFGQRLTCCLLSLASSFFLSFNNSSSLSVSLELVRVELTSVWFESTTSTSPSLTFKWSLWRKSVSEAMDSLPESLEDKNGESTKRFTPRPVPPRPADDRFLELIRWPMVTCDDRRQVIATSVDKVLAIPWTEKW